MTALGIFGTRFPSVFMGVLMGMALSSTAHATDCIDYSEFIHWLGAVDTPRESMGVTMEGHLAYVADSFSLQIMDISNPHHPTIIGAVDTPGGFAQRVAVSGDYAYLANVRLDVIDVSNPSAPSIVASLDTPGAVYDVAVAGQYVYVADYASGFRVVDVSDPSSPVITGSCATRGYARSVVLDGSYAYVAEEHGGFQIIDISNPASPAVVGTIDSLYNVHDAVVAGNYAYLADLGEFVVSMQVVDISNVASPIIVGHVNTASPIYGLDVADNHVYAAGRESGLLVIDVSSPTEPTIVGRMSTPSAAYDVDVSGGLACVADYGTGLHVVDITIPTSPSFISGFVTPHIARDVAVSGGNAFIAEDVGLQVVDVSNASAPLSLGVVKTGDCSGVAVQGPYVYVTTASGLTVIDVTNPLNATIIGSAETPGFAIDVAIVGGFAYVADADSGLSIIDISNPFVPVRVGQVGLPSIARSVAAAGNYAYVAVAVYGVPADALRIVDVSVPSSAGVVGSCDAPGDGFGLAVSGDYVYFADGHSGLQIVDVSDPLAPIIAETLYTPAPCGPGVAIVGDYAYLAGGGGLQVVNVSTPTAPVLVGNVMHAVGSLAVAGDYAYLVNDDRALWIFPAQCSSPNAVEISALVAKATSEGILVEWRTSFEFEHLGFHVHRSVHEVADYVQMTHDLIEPPGPYRYLDARVEPGTTYYYRLEAVDRSGASEFFGPVQATAAIAEPSSPRFVLSQSQPNPFVAEVGATVIGFTLERQVHTKLRVFDASGRLVRVLVDERLGAGPHAARWDGRNDGGGETGSGIYYYRLEAGEFSEARALVKIN